MEMNYGLFQQQTQKLFMTKELRQAITLLQYPTIELTEFLYEEIVNNPVFEIDDKELARYEYFYRNQYKSRSIKYSSEEDFNIWEKISVHEISLEEHLLEQARFLSLRKKDYEILKFLIGSLDESGYLKVPLDEVGKRFQISVADVNRVLRILQSLEPKGIGARDLKESLLLQLKAIDPIDYQAIEIVEHHLSDLAERKFTKIAKKLQITTQEVQLLFDFIRTLSPKPAMGFNGGELPRYIIPDVILEFVDDEFVVIVNDAMLPRLKINPYYRQYLLNNPKGDQTSKYIIEKFHSAEWLIKSIEQRRNTLYKVTNAIIKHQVSFFKNHSLKPLKLREIADEIGMHESTVSRAVNQKYLQTPLGIFELKYFFSTGLSTSDGDVTSSENVKKLLQEIIDNEDKRKPLSDQKIANLLNKKGINISRRTIAKYRDELGILSSSARKRY
ncbi:RNA polymerase sigma-54 factor [Vulcanibacillus modesticaldus]|uniref:RNA polymerase sigma-54 factor n=2 Tax=Vulcanibacillus modesticaldus TaxID=337097 RepID=A0A1D2YVL5_9BACI|nr:RNA polymerase sigma-54 factor [Vulcanibacillus modesticaldus]